MHSWEAQKLYWVFVDFKLYNPDITLTFSELFITNNFNNQSLTQSSFQSYLNTFQSNILSTNLYNYFNWQFSLELNVSLSVVKSRYNNDKHLHDDVS